MILCFMASAGIALLAAAMFVLVGVHVVHGRRMRLAEARTLSGFQSAECPESICVQLPVRNEEAVIQETLRSLCQLDWPRDRLEILVLDDNSSDQTLALAQAAAAEWQELGVNIRIVSHETRVTKGGLLQFGLSLTKADYIAVFDADFRPEPDVLRKLMCFLREDDRTAFVQARLDYRNRNATWVTRSQALDLDTYYAFDQVARTWAGIPVAYNGTGGIWRRSALVDAGGWTARSFLEDVDASFRTFHRGWHGRFLTTVAVPGHLPETVRQFATQRLRWSIGWHQQFQVLPLKTILKKGSLRSILFALFFLLDTSAPLLVAVNALLIAAAFALGDAHATVALVVFLVSLVAFIDARVIGTWLALRQCARRLEPRMVLDLWGVWVLYLVLLPVAIAAPALMLGKAVPRFEQTLKSG